MFTCWNVGSNICFYKAFSGRGTSRSGIVAFRQTTIVNVDTDAERCAGKRWRDIRWRWWKVCEWGQIMKSGTVRTNKTDGTGWIEKLWLLKLGESLPVVLPGLVLWLIPVHLTCVGESQVANEQENIQAGDLVRGRVRLSSHKSSWSPWKPEPNKASGCCCPLEESEESVG